MDKIISASLASADLSPDARVSFSIRYFDKETVGYQPLSEKRDISYTPAKSGMYIICAHIKDSRSINHLIFPHKYIPPENKYLLDNQNGQAILARDIINSQKTNKISSYCATFKETLFKAFPCRLAKARPPQAAHKGNLFSC